MGDLATSLPAFFGYVGARATKERGAYLLNGAKIHRANITPKEISANYKLLKKIEQAGFAYADVIIPATNGTPYVSLGRDIFVMTRHVAGREPDMKNFCDVKKITECLAAFHNAARGLEESHIPVQPPLCDAFAKQIAALGATVKQINRQTRLSDFDVLVLKNADAYISRAENAAEILAATNYSALYENAVKNAHICHAALKEETFTFAPVNDECYISRFENAEVDLQICDLVSILRRYVRKSGRETPIHALTDAYGKISPLPADAEKIIHAMLLFPWPFLKNVAQYYSKKRVFIPAAITTRMASVLDEQAAYDAFLHTIYKNNPPM